MNRGSRGGEQRPSTPSRGAPSRGICSTSAVPSAVRVPEGAQQRPRGLAVQQRAQSRPPVCLCASASLGFPPFLVPPLGETGGGPGRGGGRRRGRGKRAEARRCCVERARPLTCCLASATSFAFRQPRLHVWLLHLFSLICSSVLVVQNPRCESVTGTKQCLSLLFILQPSSSPVPLLGGNQCYEGFVVLFA